MDSPSPNEFRPKEPFTALGIDVGGTKTAVGVVRFPRGEIVSEKSIPTLAARPSEITLEEIAGIAEELVAKAGQVGDAISGVGIGICELIGSQGQILSHSCLAWNKSQVQGRLSHLGPVTLEADVRAAARAEALFGAGRPFRIFLYITVGTGIACSLIIEGLPYLGSRGATGTMASSPVNWSCENCGHANNQSLEQIASGPALVKRFNQLEAGTASSGQAVFAAAAAGSSEAARIIRSAGQALGSTVALMVNVLDPEAVIIGGGLGLSEGHFWSSFIDSTRQRVWSDIHRDLPILRAATGVRAGMIGAAISAWKRWPIPADRSRME
jgi:glucokinase